MLERPPLNPLNPGRMNSASRHRDSLVLRIILPTLLMLIGGLLIQDAALAEKKKKKKDTVAQIAGAVSNMDGEKLRDIQVVVLHVDSGQTVGQDTTTKKGEFEIEVAEASGKYAVTFSGEGFADFTGEVELIAGEQQNLDVKLLSAEEGVKSEAIAFYNAAAEAHRARDLDLALEKFQQAVALDPTLAPSHLGIADIHLQQGNVEAAIVAAERFVEMKPDDEQGKKVLFEAYRRAGQLDKAKAIAGDVGEEALTQDMAIGVYNEGALASQNGDYETALAKFQEAAELNPKMAQAHAGVASILYNQEQLDGAFAAAERALALEPENRQGMRIKYLALDAKGQISEALAVWDAYQVLDADGAIDLLYRRADLDFQAGDSARAQEALKKVLSVKPDFARAHYTLGLTYTATDPTKAKEHLQKFIELAPDDPEVPAAKEILAYF